MASSHRVVPSWILDTLPYCHVRHGNGKSSHGHMLPGANWTLDHKIYRPLSQVTRCAELMCDKAVRNHDPMEVQNHSTLIGCATSSRASVGNSDWCLSRFLVELCEQNWETDDGTGQSKER